jgi:hypothetical protein
MMAAGRQIIENSKKISIDNVSTFLSFLEPILNRKPEKDENLDSFDYRREAVDTVYEVLCTGSDIIQPEGSHTHSHEHSHDHSHSHEHHG